MKRLAMAVAIAGLAASGCSRDDPAASTPPAAESPAISGLPVSMSVRQRSTTPVPGSSDELSLTVDDITRGQVMVGVTGNRGDSLLGTRSMKPGDSATLRLGDTDYSLELVELDNALVGEDFARFVISHAGRDSMTEERKIERLIAFVESMSGSTFIRNGGEHSAADAAAHLRRKLDAAPSGITTASRFIELIASRSSMTGRRYEVRMAEDRSVFLDDCLREELQRMESGR